MKESRKMFCPNCGSWVEEPSVQSWGPQWTRFHLGLCPKCETHLLGREPASSTTSERIESPAALESPSERKGLKLPRLFVRKVGHAAKPREQVVSLKTKGDSKSVETPGEGRTSPKLGDKLYVGMPYDDIVRLLGKPSGMNPGAEMLEAGPRGKVVASEETRSRLARTQYCMWKRPEGRYLLVIESDRLVRIYEKP